MIIKLRNIKKFYKKKKITRLTLNEIKNIAQKHKAPASYGRRQKNG